MDWIFTLPPIELTERDQKLIALLRQNARRPVSEIAAILATSRQTMQKRIDRLVELNVIQRFTVEVSEDVSPAATGTFTVMFTLNLRQSTCSRVFAAIRHWPELLQCWSIAGDRDMVTLFEFQNHSETDVMREKLSRHADVVEVTTSHILKKWK